MKYFPIIGFSFKRILKKTNSVTAIDIYTGFPVFFKNYAFYMNDQPIFFKNFNKNL